MRGDIVEIFPAGNSEIAIRVEFFGDEIDRLCEEEVVTGKVTAELKHICIFPASHYAVGSQKMQAALAAIERDLDDEVKAFREDGKLLEAQRLEQRTRYDLEMMREVGYCSGVENYSRYFRRAQPGRAALHAAGLLPGRFSRLYRREPYDHPADPARCITGIFPARRIWSDTGSVCVRPTTTGRSPLRSSMRASRR